MLYKPKSLLFLLVLSFAQSCMGMDADGAPQDPPQGIKYSDPLKYQNIREACVDIAEVDAYIPLKYECVVALKHNRPLSIIRNRGNLLNCFASGIFTGTDPIHFSVTSGGKKTVPYRDEIYIGESLRTLVGNKDIDVYFLSANSSILQIRWDRRDQNAYTQAEIVAVLRESINKLFEHGICPDSWSDFAGQDWTENKGYAFECLSSFAAWRFAPLSCLIDFTAAVVEANKKPQ